MLSYPGIAFSFPLQHSAWSVQKDFVSLLSSSATQAAASMAIFSGESWPEARKTLFTGLPLQVKAFGPLIKNRDHVPDEVTLVKIHGAGRLELQRAWSGTSFWLQMGKTTPQELVAELGPPDAIYHKNDQRLAIHKGRNSNGRRARSHQGRQDDATDTDQSSAHTVTDDSDEEFGENGIKGSLAGECFYNYFYHGFDILISSPTEPSPTPPSAKAAADDADTNGHIANTYTRLVATKILLHSNVPGSYPFNRHRRCRWELSYLSPVSTITSTSPASTASIISAPITSETSFSQIAARLHDEWQSIYASADEARHLQRGMVLNRGWGGSPGSSCELMGGWEDSVADTHGKEGAVRGEDDEDSGQEEVGLGNTELFGFPGLVFEVLKNGVVGALTVL